MTTLVTFATDSSLWPAFEGADRLPSGAEPRFAEVALAGVESSAMVAILSGDSERGGVILAIEGITENDETVSGSLWFGPEVSESAAEALAAALLAAAGGPLAVRIEALTAAGFHWIMLP